MLYEIDGGLTAAPELFSNLTSIVFAALTLAHAMMMPLGGAVPGETDTTLPTVAPAKAILMVVPVLAGIFGGLMLAFPLRIPDHTEPL